MMVTDKCGIYVHIPFCVRKCNYCDFCSTAANDELKEKYTKAIIKEINGYKKTGNRIKADTLFFGGGTPSVLSGEMFSQIYTALTDTFDFDKNSEISIELNPGTVTSEKLDLYKKLGINRLSIGMQSIHENELKKLGRIHLREDFLKCYSMARDVGFKNINIDLMYGIPNQTKNSFAETLYEVLALNPEHISAYGLIIEENTPFYKERERLLLPTEDDECDMYYSAHELLSSSGYVHYEISNYAKDGFTCKHNLGYWKNKEYIGLGISAHSYFSGVRFYNTDNFSEYFSGNEEKYRYRERISLGIDETEYIMLALRLAAGISLADYKEKFGKDFCCGRERLISEYEKAGLVKTDNKTLALTYKGFYVSNSIIASFI